MGFMKPKEPAPAPVPTVPSVEPLTVQQNVDEAETDKTLKKKQQLRAGKSALTVGLKQTSGVNVGTPEKQSGLSVGGS